MLINANNPGDTIADYLRLAADDLRGSGCEEARRDAEVLLCAVLECNRAWLYAYGDHYLDKTARDLFCHYVALRSKGEPVAYILGQREFWSLMLLVNDSTLIPRPDTEILVEQALQRGADMDIAYVLDLGTGSGAIALALAHEKPLWQVDAVDVSTDAVELAARNAERLDLSNVNVYCSDWFSSVRENTAAPDARFHLVVSNPPYIAADDPHLVAGDLRFEPHTALVAADDGYADLFLLARHAREFLRQDGWLLLEHGFGQGDRLRQYLCQQGYSDVQTVTDYGGNERVTSGRWSGRSVP